MNKERNGFILGLLLFCICTILVVTSTVIAGIYWLGVDIDNTKEVKCYISVCDTYSETCSQSHTNSYKSGDKTYYYTYYTYYTCIKSLYTYYATIDGKNITDGDSGDDDYCYEHPVGYEFSCYYDARSPDTITTVKSNNYGGAIAFVVIFGIISIIMIVVSIIMIIMICSTFF